MLSLTLLGLCWASLAAASSSFTPARPPALPLAVKSPYLSTWLNAGSDGGNGGYLPGEWPVFWSNQITGWTGLIRVDGTTYTWLGDPVGPALATQTSYEYTSTRSIVKIDVDGKVDMTITFLSPVTPNDLKRQSLIFSYMRVEVASSDGNTHDVQLYSDISAEWISGDRSNIAQWDYGNEDDIAYHKVYRQTQQLFSEVSDQTEYGNWYYATDSVSNLTYQSGADNTVRGQFEDNGVLPNSQDSDYRAINDDYPVFGFAKDLGSLSSSSVSTLFTIGLCQEDAVQFDGASGVVPLKSLWTSYFSSDIDALSFFHKDYCTSSDLSTSLDNQIESDSLSAAGQDYLTITSLSVRQTLGATQLVGTPDMPYLFLKEISSDGNVQTVDVIFPSHPFFLYANPNLLKYLLDPLFVNQESGQYPNNYSMHDLGASYPNGTGHPDGNDEQMPLEECGNMLIMTLAYAQRAKDNDYLSQHYNILRQWTSYLVDEALYPANQISTDDFAGALANQTNLALKGIIGINAMATIAQLTGNTADATNYANISRTYIQKWQQLATVPANGTVPAHTSLAYGDTDSHGLLYNLYANSELGFDLVPQEVYDMQSAFYPTVELTYGVPLDTRHDYTKGDWELFTAAIASASTRAMFIKDLATWINETPTNRPLTDLYDANTGDYPGIDFVARPVVGGSFALLALQGLGN
ncbi:glutaminase GtaA [Saccharata proteae CBS 121410]|uniref:Glutaminase GtaA n=1 Tax=Saccharata proteae CBS 121410 TaxID=1314787 RepID=A0A9P4I1C2_9PEZI|nr:glutaminase GtaA [Saccharata proteae CBS 121410]